MYLGFTDGEVECFIPNFMPGFTASLIPAEEKKPSNLSQEIAAINQEIDKVIESKVYNEELGKF